MHRDLAAEGIALDDRAAFGVAVDDLPARVGVIVDGDAGLHRRRAAIAGAIDGEAAIIRREMRGLVHPEPMIVRRRMQEDHRHACRADLFVIKRAGNARGHVIQLFLKSSFPRKQEI
jgi:hypothetical protein